MPFAVVGSREEIVVGGHKVRARQYPWGTVEGETPCVVGSCGGCRTSCVSPAYGGLTSMYICREWW